MVVKFSYTDRHFISKDTGSTYVIFNYGNFIDTLFVIITEPPRDEIKYYCKQSNITFFSGYIDSTKTYQWQVDTLNGFEDVIPDSVYLGIDSSTLVLTNPPTNWKGYSYRCKISDDAGFTESELFVLNFENKWNGSIDSAWENPLNWDCGVIPDGYTDVIIKSNVPNLPIVSSFAQCRSIELQNEASIIINTGFDLNITNWNN
jgi:hypothetical protein